MVRLAVVACAVLTVSFVPDQATAQTFRDAFISALDQQCLRLGGSSGSELGSQLEAICNDIPANASGGSNLTLDSRSDQNEQRLLRRLQERREQKAASADWSQLRGLSVFGSTDYQYAEKGVTQFEPGFTRDSWGATVGADYLLMNGKGLVGLALNYNHQDSKLLRRSGDIESDAFGPTVYGSYFPMDDLFIDGYVGYAFREYTIERRFTFVMGAATQIPAGRVHGDTSSDEWKFGLNSGYDFHLGRFTVGPRLGFDFRENHIDGYAERGATGLELAFNRQHQTSLTSKLGVFASFAQSMGWGVLVPQATFDWRHEFEDDQRVIYFHFVQDSFKTRFRFQTDTPDRDYFNAGLGVVALLPNGLAPFLNVREFFGYRKQSSTTVTAGLRLSF
jgi:outer membrane autotransporter protein